MPTIEQLGMYLHHRAAGREKWDKLGQVLCLISQATSGHWVPQTQGTYVLLRIAQPKGYKLLLFAAPLGFLFSSLESSCPSPRWVGPPHSFML